MTDTTSTATGEPWDRQPGETARQHGRFTVFRNLGHARSVQKCVETLNAQGDTVTYRALGQVAWSNGWTARAGAWDVEQDRQDREQLVEDRKAMAVKHRTVAGSLLHKALAALKTIDTQDLDAQDVVRLVKLATDIERLAMALPTQQVAVTGSTGGPVDIQDLSSLSTAERRQRLADIATELARRSGVPAGDGTDRDTDDDDGDSL